MFNNGKKLLFALLCAAMLSFTMGQLNVAMATEAVSIDALSSATVSGSVAPVNPENYEDEQGTAIPAEDKALPYEGEFVTSYSYNNEYGFLILSINEDMLDGHFVNAITHIGINDTKYTYGTVNKDKSSWYEIYVPYKYINEGENDLYFYLDGITYKVRFKTSSAFQKQLISPVLIPQEVVPGKNETMLLDIRADGYVDIEEWYKAFRPEHVSVTEIFTVSSSYTKIDPQNYDVTLNEDKNTLNIRFKDYEINQLHVYRVAVAIPDYIITYRDVILYEAPPELTGEWQTDGNNSYRITDKNDTYSVYLREISKLTLVDSSGESKVLTKDEDYTAKLGLVEIYPGAFASGEEYTILISHPSVATAKLVTTAPAISPITRIDLFLDDIMKGEAVTFSHANSEWLSAISKITAYQANVGGHEVTDWSRSSNTINIPAGNFSKRDNTLWTLTIEAKGFEDVVAPVYVIGEPNKYDPDPVLLGSWKTQGDFSYLIEQKGDKYSTYLWSKVQNVLLVDKTTDIIKKLEVNKDYTQGYTIELYASNFAAEHEYAIKLVSSAYKTAVIETGVPPIPVIKQPAVISIEDILENRDLTIVSADADWINAVSSVTITDERGYSETVTSLHKDGNTIIIPAAVINSSKIQKPIGAFVIKIAAAGYEEYVDKFFVLKDSISVTQSLESGKVKLYFVDDGSPAYDFADSVTLLELNGRSLNPSEYVRDVTGTTIYISERLLLDGENTILITSNRSSDLTVTFNYANEALRTLKIDIEALIEGSKMSEDQKEFYLKQVNDAVTVKEVNSIKIQVEKDIDALSDEPGDKFSVNEDGTYNDGDGNTYIKDGEYIAVEQDENGNFVDNNGNVYIPDGEGGFGKYESNGDGTYTGPDDRIYIPDPDNLGQFIIKSEGSGEPAEPGESGEVEESEGPDEPGESGEAEESEEPDESGDPGEVEESEEPDESEEPGESGEVEESEEAGEAEDPGEAEDSNETEEAEEPDEPNVNIPDDSADAGGSTVTVPDGSTGGGSTSSSTSGKGGSSSSGNSGSKPVTITSEKKPNQPVTAAASVTATAGANGSASAVIPDEAIIGAIAKAQSDAKAQGKTANGIAIEVNVTVPKDTASLSITLTQAALQSLVDAKAASLEISSALVSISLDEKTLAEIQKQSSGNVTISIDPVKNLSSSAKAVIDTRPVYDITISYMKDEKITPVSSLNGGIVTLSIPYTPSSKEASGYLHGVYVDSNGNVSRIDYSAYDANAKAILIPAMHLSVYGVGYTDPSAEFTDIATHWGKDSIDYVVGRGLLEGTSDTTFAPDIAMTRGMLVTALGRLAGIDTKSYTTNSFTDVELNTAFQPYIEWAYKKGIMQGIGNGQFAPDRAITREEIAVIFANYAKATGYTLPVTREATTYIDASSIGSVYKSSVTVMQQAGIMMGRQNNEFNPKSNATRAEVSAMLYRYIKLTIDPDTAQGWALDDNGQHLYYKDGKVLVGWQAIGGARYFFTASGALQTGWVKDGDNWRFYSGNKMFTGWLDTGVDNNNKTYYFTTDGLMVSDKWLEIDGKWYYFNPDGSLAKNTKIDGYEIDENGERKNF